MPKAAFDAAEALELDSSTSSDNPSDAGADSSPAEDGKPLSLLDAVRDAVAPDSSSEDGSGDEGEDDQVGDPEANAADADADADEPPPASEEEAVSRLMEELREEGRSLQKVQRFNEVLTENKQLKSEVGELRTMRSQLDDIAQAAQRSGLEAQMVVDLFSMPLLFSQDPVEALKKLNAVQEHLATLAGDKLPKELQAKVEDGYLSEEDAREIARARAEAQRLRQQSEFDASQREADAQRKAVEDSRNALNSYQQSLISSDPDYTPAARKWHVDRLAQMVAREGRPATQQQAVEMAERAWKDVKSDMATLIPKRSQTTQRVPGRRTTSAPSTAPSSMLEAVSAVVGGASSED